MNYIMELALYLESLNEYYLFESNFAFLFTLPVFVVEVLSISALIIGGELSTYLQKANSDLVELKLFFSASVLSGIVYLFFLRVSRRITFTLVSIVYHAANLVLSFSLFFGIGLLIKQQSTHGLFSKIAFTGSEFLFVIATSLLVLASSYICHLIRRNSKLKAFRNSYAFLGNDLIPERVSISLVKELCVNYSISFDSFIFKESKLLFDVWQKKSGLEQIESCNQAIKSDVAYKSQIRHSIISQQMVQNLSF